MDSKSPITSKVSRSATGRLPTAFRMRRFLLLLFLFSPCLLASEPEAERQKELKQLLKNDCGACHGMTLKGGLGPSLLAKDLKDKPEDFLVTTILEGRNGTAMPPWKRFLDEDEVEWIVKWLLEDRGVEDRR